MNIHLGLYLKTRYSNALEIKYQAERQIIEACSEGGGKT